MNSVNPFRIEGQKTAAFEIVDVLGDAPDVHCIPVGNAGNITAYWRATPSTTATASTAEPPRMLGWQAAGAAPLVLGEPVPHPETIATAIRIGNPASWDSAIDGARRVGAAIGAVTDAQILDAYRAGRARGRVRRAGVRGVGRRAAPGARGRARRPRARPSCAPSPGHGLKDTEWAIAGAAHPVSVPADAAVVAEELGLGDSAR